MKIARRAGSRGALVQGAGSALRMPAKPFVEELARRLLMMRDRLGRNDF